MNERIKELRKALGLTQQEMADKVGIKRNTIAQYEIGRNPPTDTVVALVCREFDVNEEWLRTGVGPMFREKTRDEDLAEFFGKVLAGDPDFRRRLLSAMSRLTEEQWAMLEEVAQRLALIGHTSTEMLRHYQDVSLEDLRRITDAI